MLDNESIYQRIISVVTNREWEAYEATMQAFLKYLQAAPSTLVAFASLVMANCPKGGTFFNTALSFLPLDDWPTVVYHAMVILRRDPANKAAQSIIEYANLQCPAAIQPYKEELAYLPAKLYLAAFDDPPALYPAYALHMAFLASYLSELLEKRFPKAEDRCHPTWVEAPGGASTFPFGGVSKAICGICSERLHHIITFDRIPDGLGVTDLPTLELSVCLVCLSLGSGVLSYQHDERGHPHDISQGKRWPQFTEVRESFHFKPTSVALADLGPRWQRQDWGSSNGRENLYRIGGHPTWVQNAEYAPCPLCGNHSTFLMQLDEGLLTIDEQRGNTWSWDWSGGGMGYILWCNSCKASSFFDQYT
jgi:hypothetical protein